MATNRQIHFLKEYSEIKSKEDYEEVMHKYKCSLQLDERDNRWEAFLPSTNNRTQAVVFDLDELCGHEKED